MPTPTPRHRPVSRRAFGGLAAGAAATAGLAACGGGSASSEGPVNLRFTWWGSDARHQYTQQIIDAFNEEHPDIHVEGEFTEWSGYWDRLATNVAANDAPDIIQMDAIYLRSYADRGALLDLSQLDGLDTSAIDSTALDTGETGDGLFGLVSGVVPLGIMTNPALVQAAGQQMPDDTTWTWGDYEALGAAISAGTPDGTYGVANGGIDEAGLQLWVKQLGGAFYDDEGNVTLDPAMVTDWYEYNLGLIESGAAGPVTLAMERAVAALDQSGIATNTTAMQQYWATQITALAGASGQPLTLLRPPTQSPGGEPGVYYKPSMFWSASARTEHPEAVATFLDHLVNSEAVADLMLTERGIPANTQIREYISPKLSETDRLAIDYTDSLADVVEDTPPSAPAGASTIEEIVRRYGSEVLFGQQQPAAAARAMVEELTNSVESA
ncbi:ABC transporter substrate-binding protein [Kineococcus esterisolvens]|uniref:ABC transporter substrate-binding protein n=1 Tax=unclassified Kineococcus TaxID=2621656 RepID=UPI003D7E171B